MICWPAIIQFRGENELQLVESESAWQTDADLNGCCYDEDDRLIDSSGAVYALDEGSAGAVIRRVAGQYVEKDEINQLIQAHFSSVGACCAAKFAVSSVAQAIQIVRSSGDDPR
ncbi:DUF4144 family protein [Neptuniibacter halophilus]|uniref:DUF4144 family protein n=1 Tax=Neptuniibacter halophilus TaxID=651666 RepID=UPI002572AA81|nr:DUF4144 family protein [Neptuniibacter halophilus]